MGFIEGEGAFTISLRKNNSDKIRGRGYQVVPYFQMSQVCSDDNKVSMVEIQQFLKQNGINARIYRTKSSKSWHLWHMAISSLSSCLKLASCLKDLEWHTYKKLIFLNWLEALKVVESGEYKTLEGVRHIVDLRDNVKDIRKFETHSIKQMLANNIKWREWLASKENIV